MQRAVTSPTPDSSPSVPATARSDSSVTGRAATVLAAARNERTRYVDSFARSSRKAMRRRSATGSRDAMTISLETARGYDRPHADDRLGGRRCRDHRSDGAAGGTQDSTPAYGG